MKGDVFVWAVTTLAAAAPLAGQTRATVYSDGRIFVRRVIEWPLPSGVSEVAIPLELPVPGSIVALDAGVAIVSIRHPFLPLANFNADPTVLLRRSIGRPVGILYPSIRDTIRGTVISADPPRIRLTDGSIMLGTSGAMLFPGDVADSERVVVASIRSRDPRPRFELGYTLMGAPWQAQYALVLGAGGVARLSGNLLVQMDGAALDSTSFSVAEGTMAKVPQIFPVRSDEERRRIGYYPSNLPPTAPPLLDSLRSYEIPGRHTIRRSEIASLPYLAESVARVERIYSVTLVPAQSPGETSLTRQTVPTTVNPSQANVVYRVTPAPGASWPGALPAGIARIYGPLGNGGTVLLAEATLTDPVTSGPVEFVAGPTGDVGAQRMITETSIEQDTVLTATGSRRIRGIATRQEHTVVLTNRGAAAVEVEIVARRQAPWTVMSSSVPPDSATPDAVRFKVPVSARGSATFTARIRIPTS